MENKRTKHLIIKRFDKRQKTKLADKKSHIETYTTNKDDK